MNVKICNKCGKIGLDQIDFSLTWVREQYYYRNQCNKCKGIYSKQWGRDNYSWEKDAIRYDRWRRNNLDKKRQMNRNYRAKKAGLEGSYDLEDLKYIYEHQQGCCPSCKHAICFDDMSVDHIIPISWPGSSNWPNNIQLLCKSCNSSKSNRVDVDYRENKPIWFGELIGKY